MGESDRSEEFCERCFCERVYYSHSSMGFVFCRLARRFLAPRSEFQGQAPGACARPAAQKCAASPSVGCGSGDGGGGGGDGAPKQRAMRTAPEPLEAVYGEAVDGGADNLTCPPPAVAEKRNRERPMRGSATGERGRLKHACALRAAFRRSVQFSVLVRSWLRPTCGAFASPRRRPARSPFVALLS